MDHTSARQFKMRWLQLLVTSFITRSFTMFAKHVFSVIADKATDVANVEQLFISVCVVDGETVCEKFLAFLKWEKGVTSESLEDIILQQLVEWQFHLLCGQAYDDAGTMAAKSKGVAARICTKHPKAMYITHCASHRLNLCVVKCCSIKEVSNMIQTANSVSQFFSNLLKRQQTLEKWISDMLPEENRKKMKLCRTWWVERHDAFEVFLDLFLPTVGCLEEIALSHGTERWDQMLVHFCFPLHSSHLL